MCARLALAGLTLLLTPAPAFAAGTVSIDGDGFANFVAGGGDANGLSVTATISGTEATIAFADAGATVNEGEADCEKSGGTVTCTGQLVGWTAKLGDGHDTATASGNLEGGIRARTATTPSRARTPMSSRSC